MINFFLCEILQHPQINPGSASAESLVKDYDIFCRTLHTDGTSKFGKHYGTYDVVID